MLRAGAESSNRCQWSKNRFINFGAYERKYGGVGRSIKKVLARKYVDGCDVVIIF